MTGTVREMFAVLIVPIRERARTLGYAVAVHGSLARDIDLVAIPWTAEAASSDELAHAVIDVVRAHLGYEPPYGNDNLCGNPKPHGRVCWAIHLGDGKTYIDLSIMPRLAK